MALRRVWCPSPNYSSRGGSAVTTVICHTAEGALTHESLGAFFSSPSAGVSSHVGIDDKLGEIGEYVSRPNKAWTQSNANPWCVSAELCAFAGWSAAEWDRHPNMLRNCADWIAEECAHFGIPIKWLSPSEAQAGARGVTDHAALGAMGGGHWDCGASFPYQRVLDMARGGAGAQPEPEPTDEEASLITSAVAANGNFHVFELCEGWIWYTWQRKGESNWNGGATGKGPAGMSRFAPAQDIVSISAEVAANGNLHVFARAKNGKTFYTWQKANATSWAGGETGKSVAGLSTFAPSP
jgi:hypothetical protein